ncbi:MAG: TonB-dependent receptor [Calditrichaceae bacterium]|nr:TonB-dependent receptor [Calditrichaceae bacterium]MBN2708385.1 TonB-dependent receptor [Calditrichaceae bacterium]
MKNLILIIFIFSFICQSFAGAIYGHIKKTGSEERLANVIVKVQGTEYSAQSDSLGRYMIEGIKEGQYYLIFIAKSYYALIVPDVKVKAEVGTELNAAMYPGNEQEFLFLEIGGIHVTAERNLIPETPETVYRITSGELEHMQANSLADIMDHLPGIEKGKKPGLQTKQVLPLRSFSNPEYNLGALFGLKIIIDDAPLSANANLNTGHGVGYGSSVSQTTPGGSQYDLREIPAENIDHIEVIPGGGSVEYGDHSQGLVIVHTKSDNIPGRLKLKSNPDTKEANLTGGFNIGRTNLGINLNYAHSERDIRISGDEYHRISFNLKSLNTWMEKRLSLSQSFNYNRYIEEDSDDSDPDRTKAYNRDYHIKYAHSIDYKMNSVSSLYIRNYADYRRRNSRLTKLEHADFAYITDRTEPGTREAIISEPYYFSDVRTIGDEWSAGSKIKYNLRLLHKQVLHNFTAGGEYIWEKNYGKGKQFNLLNPPNGAMGIRPRSFDDIPRLSQIAIFCEDKISAKWIIPWSFNLGFRIDSYNPEKINLKNLFKGTDIFRASQGTFFNPRLGLSAKIFNDFQMRLNFSRSSKMPALSSVYPEPAFLDVYDRTIQTIADPYGGQQDTTITLVSTYIMDNSSEQLKGYQITVWEAAMDFQWDNLGFSLTAYHQKTDGIPFYTQIPYIYSRYFWPNWPSENGKYAEETVVATGDHIQFQNLIWTKDKGIEIDFRTHRIRKLNMLFRVIAAFKHTYRGSHSYNVYGNRRIYEQGEELSTGWIAPEDMQIIPYYQPHGRWNQQLVINYFTDYVYKPLGIWFTLKAQQVLFEEFLEKDNPVSSAAGYFYQNRHIPIDKEMSYLMQLDRQFDKFETTVDKSESHAKWLFSIVASKSLYKGAEISVFIENIFNDRAYYINRRGSESSRNPEIFWGVAFSSKLDEIF